MNEIQQQLEQIHAAYKALETLPEKIANAIKLRHGIDVDQTIIQRIIAKATLTAFMRDDHGERNN